METLQAEGINFYSVTDGIDTSTPAGRFFFHVMASLAQMERDLLVERTKAGLAAAKESGMLAVVEGEGQGKAIEAKLDN